MSTLAAHSTAVGVSGFAQRLAAAVRPEFQVEVLVPAVGDPILGTPACIVAGCVRSSYYDRVCQAHRHRWKKDGRPELTQWAATADPQVTGHRPLHACEVAGCRFGQHRYRLCYGHSRQWDAGGRPDRTQWSPPVVTAAAVCGVTGCRLWTELDAGWCRGHHTRWRMRGYPAPEAFIAYCATYGEDRFDFRGLSPQLRLEVQYAVQCRVDAQRARTVPRAVKPLLDHLATAGDVSLLGRPLDAWLGELPPAATSTARAFLGFAIGCLLDLRDGGGWEAEYDRDVWLLRRLSIPGAGHGAQLDFTAVQPSWLRELVKRWCRWRLSCGIGLTQVRRDLVALIRLSRLTPGLASSPGPTGLSRQSLEGYLAALAAELARPKTRRGDIGAVSGFLRAIRQHRWAMLPADAELYPDDCPRPEQATLSRAIPEFVMNQLEDPANLDRISDSRIRLLVEILNGAGLRIGDATRLSIDCLVHDPVGATYLRYRNHKMRREAMVPIDEQLAAKIADQQRRATAAFPETAVLIPRSHANPHGRHPIGPNTFDMHLKGWLTDVAVVDELGRPAKVTPHQFRHTYATRLINNDVSQEVVRRLLDHTSHTMTARYARLADTTIRTQWERARKIDIHGQSVDTSGDGLIGDAEWMNHNLARAKMALPNGYCGLPLQKSCPHANACLTCPVFITTPEFLPQHHAQREQTLQLITAAEARGQQRLAEANRTVLTNLDTIIATLETDHQDTAEDAR
ncbi:transposase [Mycobacterium sp. ENV421]|uniref:tyrosine-type recombinase/integrase n=1 Tax=Mycobacterium sp. ENV421 TaxID=1213407 RepID=UPI000C9CE68F|nr:tyrosine-type recombinase/integrase [Mycobacterium sp. ENV421]PND54137.1 transposase [Mycobacterium sp. ENV421]